MIPDFLFECSWEVCQKMGGIYTVLSTHAKTLGEQMGGRMMFIGPDVWDERPNPLFEPDPTLESAWLQQAAKEGLKVRLGRWNIPGRPMVALVDFRPFTAIRNALYGAAWEDFGVDSLHAYGDYDEASMFAYAAGRVAESYYHYALEGSQHVVFHAHEWMTGLGALYLRKHLPQVATVFTTHATTVGRSIAGNGKPLYQYLTAYNGTQMAGELNVESKHSIERQTAHHADCFTTVSDVTARECEALLDKPCEVVVMNGFEDDFVPRGSAFTARRRAARKRIFEVANALTGCEFEDDTLIVSTSGRYEYRNKGIDVFLDVLCHALRQNKLERQVLALVEVPAWVFAPRMDLQQRLAQPQRYTSALLTPFLSHWLHNEGDDKVCRFLREHDMQNRSEDKLKVLFVPCYLDGNDGIVDLTYYDLLAGLDLAVYPSYYEPWGYTPLEAAAFHVPCVTTSLSGFGMWVEKEKGGQATIEDGVAVVRRDDYNYDEVVSSITDILTDFARKEPKEVTAIRRRAGQLAEKARWSHFIEHYLEAYEVALRKAEARMQQSPGGTNRPWPKLTQPEG